MKQRRLILVLLGVLFVFAFSASQVYANTNVYSVNSGGSLTSGGSAVNFDSFLEKVHRNIISEVIALSTESLVSGVTVTGGLEVVNYSGEPLGGNLWTDTNFASSWADSTSGSYFNLRAGSEILKVYVPHGKEYIPPNPQIPNSVGQYRSVNQSEISATVNLVNKYKDAVRTALNFASLQHAINVYSFYPSKLVYVEQLINFPADNSEGTINANSGVSYSLDYIMHPFQGKKDSGEVSSMSTWEIPNGVEASSANASKVTFEVNDEYGVFLGNAEGRASLSDLSVGAASTSNGVISATSSKTKQTVHTKHGVDSTLRLAVPSKFVRSAINEEQYRLPDTEGYSLVDGVRLRVTLNHVYRYNEELNSYKDAGAYQNFNIDRKSLVVSKLEVDEEGNPKAGTNKYIGVVIPLWYKEAVFVSALAGGGTDEVYFTGRELRFSNDFTTKSSITGVNEAIFQTYTIEGSSAGNLRNYAFNTGTADITNEEAHVPLKSRNPETFEIISTFHQTGTGYGGFTMFLNNSNTEDRELRTWLRSTQAQALADVKAQRLLELLNGIFEITQEPYGYLEWSRLQDIRTELEEAKENRLWKVIYTILFVFGILLSFYSTILHFAYWLDRFNIFMEFQFFGFLTNGKMNVDPEGVGLTKFRSFTPSDGTVTYVTLGRLLVMNAALYILAFVVIQAPAVIRIIVNIYYTMTSWVGV